MLHRRRPSSAIFYAPHEVTMVVAVVEDEARSMLYCCRWHTGRCHPLSAAVITIGGTPVMISGCPSALGDDVVWRRQPSTLFTSSTTPEALRKLMSLRPPSSSASSPPTRTSCSGQHEYTAPLACLPLLSHAFVPAYSAVLSSDHH